VPDINSTDREVKVVLELLGVKEEDIAINACDGKLEVLTNAPHRNYHKLIELPKEAFILLGFVAMHKVKKIEKLYLAIWGLTK